MELIQNKIIKPSNNLKKYMKADALKFPDLADAYLEISRCTYDLLVRFPKNWKKLEEGYPELLEILKIIQDKKSIVTFETERDSVWKNKDQASKDINLCISLMLDLKGYKINRNFSICASFVAVFSLFISFMALFR